MAQACIAGISGAVTLPSGHALKSRAWSLTINNEVNDSSGFSSTSDYRENLAGMKSWSGAVSGYVESGAASVSPFAATVSTPVVCAFGAGATTLTASSGNTYTGSIIVTSVAIGTGIDGNATVAITFVGNGVLSENWTVA